MVAPRKYVVQTPLFQHNDDEVSVQKSVYVFLQSNGICVAIGEGGNAWSRELVVFAYVVLLKSDSFGFR